MTPPILAGAVIALLARRSEVEALLSQCPEWFFLTLAFTVGPVGIRSRFTAALLTAGLSASCVMLYQASHYVR